MNVIVGLGNPGHTYHGSRHNVGFAVIERLAQLRGVNIAQSLSSPVDGRPAAVFGDYERQGRAVRLLMPLTMMNESGEALRAWPMKPAQTLIVCDDVYLPLGTLRLRPGGSAGGHNGLRSCLEAAGTEELPRLRIGVGIGAVPSALRDFVLSRFDSAERPVIKTVIEQAAEACEAWAMEGIETAMNRHNKGELRDP